MKICYIHPSKGSCIEDINRFRNEKFKVNPNYQFCRADTIFRVFNELSGKNRELAEEIIVFYNQRTITKHTFDAMNNDFIPSSFMEQNTVFTMLTAIIRNFHIAFIKRVSAVFGTKIIRPTSRIKTFVREFLCIPFKWILKGQWQFRLYTDRPYDKLML